MKIEILYNAKMLTHIKKENYEFIKSKIEEKYPEIKISEVKK